MGAIASGLFQPFIRINSACAELPQPVFPLASFFYQLSLGRLGNFGVYLESNHQLRQINSTLLFPKPAPVVHSE